MTEIEQLRADVQRLTQALAERDSQLVAIEAHARRAEAVPMPKRTSSALNAVIFLRRLHEDRQREISRLTAQCIEAQNKLARVEEMSNGEIRALTNALAEAEAKARRMYLAEITELQGALAAERATGRLNPYIVRAGELQEQLREARETIGWLNRCVAEREASLAEAQAALTVSEATLDMCNHPADLACGHAGFWAYSDDGGKHIVCLLCVKADRDRIAAALTASDQARALAEGQVSALRESVIQLLDLIRMGGSPTTRREWCNAADQVLNDTEATAAAHDAAIRAETVEACCKRICGACHEGWVIDSAGFHAQPDGELYPCKAWQLRGNSAAAIRGGGQ